MNGVIGFYDKNKPYYEFTNFYQCNIRINGMVWPSSEHYFQAQKFHTDQRLVNMIRQAATAREAFDLARQYDGQKRRDWDQAKTDIMRQIVWEKFSQNQVLGALLKSTGNAILEEHSPFDSFWGIYNGVGQNWLGIILMETRSKL